MKEIEQLRSIVSGKRIFDTLGGRSKFKIEFDNNHIIIITSSGKQYKVNDELVSSVFYRFKTSSIAKRYTTSNYTDPLWPDCPNRVLSPYIARIFKEDEKPSK